MTTETMTGKAYLIGVILSTVLGIVDYMANVNQFMLTIVYASTIILGGIKIVKEIKNWNK